MLGTLYYCLRIIDLAELSLELFTFTRNYLTCQEKMNQFGVSRMPYITYVPIVPTHKQLYYLYYGTIMTAAVKYRV